MVAVLPNPLATKQMTLTTISARTIGVGLVEPTAPVCVRSPKGRMTRVCLAPAFTQSGHCQPTAACTMQSVQMGRSQWAQTTEAGRSSWRAQVVVLIGSPLTGSPGPRVTRSPDAGQQLGPDQAGDLGRVVEIPPTR